MSDGLTKLENNDVDEKDGTNMKQSSNRQKEYIRPLVRPNIPNVKTSDPDRKDKLPPNLSTRKTVPVGKPSLSSGSDNKEPSPPADNIKHSPGEIRLPSPRDSTELMVNGKPFDDSSIEPIKIPEDRLDRATCKHVSEPIMSLSELKRPETNDIVDVILKVTPNNTSSSNPTSNKEEITPPARAENAQADAQPEDRNESKSKKNKEKDIRNSSSRPSPSSSPGAKPLTIRPPSPRDAVPREMTIYTDAIIDAARPTRAISPTTSSTNTAVYSPEAVEDLVNTALSKTHDIPITAKTLPRAAISPIKDIKNIHPITHQENEPTDIPSIKHIIHPEDQITSNSDVRPVSLNEATYSSDSNFEYDEDVRSPIQAPEPARRPIKARKKAEPFYKSPRVTRNIRELYSPISTPARSKRSPIYVEDTEPTPIKRKRHRDRSNSDRSYDDAPARSKKPKRTKKKKKRSRRKEVEPEYTHPDYESMSPAEKRRHREDFRIKFGILRENFPTYEIPDFEEDISLEEIHVAYDRYVKNIHAHNGASEYMGYLAISWLALEFICTKFLGLPASGFTMSQLRSMSRYKRMLIELGEKNYGGEGSGWPVEIRIIFISLVNAAVFIVIKFFANYLGGGEAMANTIMDLISGFINGSGDGQTPGHNPDGTAADVPEMSGDGLMGMLGNFMPMINQFMGGQNNQAGGAPVTPSASATTPRTPARPRYTE